MPRLLILCEFPTLLGGERSMLATLPAVAAAGFEIHIAAPPKGTLGAVLGERGIGHVAWQTRGDDGKRLPLDQLRAELAATFRRVRPDLVHANSLSTARIAGPVIAHENVSSIGHLRDILKLTQAEVADLNANNRLVAVSQATRDYHVAQGLDADRCVVIHNGVDLQEFSPRRPTGYLNGELGLPPNAPLVVTIGQLGLRKGTEVALAAAHKIASDEPDVHWLIVGERTSNKLESRLFESSLHAIAAESPLLGRVHFLGSRSDVPRLMTECSLLVHAAREEPLGRVLLEAAASGLAVVATDVGGTREIFPSHADGAQLVPPDDVDAMFRAVLSLLRDDEQRRELAAGARQRAEAAFDIRHAATRLIKVYEKVLI